jgi:hypothetical protein
LANLGLDRTHSIISSAARIVHAQPGHIVPRDRGPVIGNGRAWKGEGVPAVRIFSPLWHFPFPRKRFMVRSDFADRRRKSIINIKGLAKS